MNDRVILKKVFSYLRGALRGLHGVEDFRGKSIVFFGMNALGIALVALLADSGIGIYFRTEGMKNYYMVQTVYDQAVPWEGQPADVVMDLENQKIKVGERTISFEEIGNDPYTQGIHDFYL